MIIPRSIIAPRIIKTPIKHSVTGSKP